MIKIFHFLRVTKLINQLGKIFSIEENGMNPGNSAHTTECLVKKS